MAEGEQAPKVCPTCGNVLGMQKELAHVGFRGLTHLSLSRFM
jgi:hypothetical protein